MFPMRQKLDEQGIPVFNWGKPVMEYYHNT